MTSEPARKLPERILSLDSLRSVDDLTKRISESSSVEEFKQAAGALLADYAASQEANRKLQEENSYLRAHPDEESESEKDREIARLKKENKNLEEELEDTKKQVFTDQLTGLDKRIVAELVFPELLAKARRDNDPLSVVMIDVDDFGLYNNTYGHVQGDSALKTVARVMQEQTRDSDVVARYGGEEFLILLPGADENGALKKICELRDAIAATDIPVIDEETLLCRDGNHARKTICAGIYTIRSREGIPFATAVGYADQALYASKYYVDEKGEKPKNKVSLYTKNQVQPDKELIISK